MLRALPSIMRSAASMSAALRSRILARCDFAQLSLADRADLLALLGAAAAVDAGGLAQHVAGGRRLEHEGEGAVLEDRDLGRDDLAGLRGGLLVVLLAELHDVDRVLTERRADRRRRRRLARLQLDADYGTNFLGHWCYLCGPSAPASPPVSASPPLYAGAVSATLRRLYSIPC